jgi:hypothetical protein
MRVAAAILSNAAEVRDSLLFVLGGGANRIHRDTYPAPLGAVLALTLEIENRDYGRDFGLLIEVTDSRKASVAKVEGTIEPSRDVGETVVRGLKGYASAVVNLSRVSIPRKGVYRLAISIGGRPAASITFLATD